MESVEAQAYITVSLATSTPRISLSAESRDPVLLLTVRARRTAARPLTLCTADSVLDNGHHARHDGVFLGAFLPLISTSDPKRKIQLHFSGWPNYGSQPNASDNLLERDYLRFETVPGKGEGELSVTHEISLKKLLSHSDLKLENVKAGEKFTVRMSPKKLKSSWGWWSWGSLEDELKGKKFAKWDHPDSHGNIENLMPGEKMPDVKGMGKKGWVFSEPSDDLKVEATDAEEIVLEFSD